MTIIIDKNTTKKDFETLIKSLKKDEKKGIDLSKHCGVIKLEKDALQIQKEIRNEW